MVFNSLNIVTNLIELENIKEEDFDRNSLFRSREWAATISNGFEAKIFLLKTCTTSGIVIGKSILFEKRKFGFKIIGSPLSGTFTPYSGIFFDDKLTVDQKKYIVYHQVQLLLQKGYVYIEIKMPHFLNNSYVEVFEDLNKMGFTFEKNKTLMIDLSIGSDAIWEAFESRARNMVRKAFKNNVSCKISSFNLLWNKYYEFIEMTFNKQYLRMPHPKKAYQAIAESLREGEDYFFITAFKNNEIIGASLFLIDNQKMIYHSGATNDIGAKNAASSLIQWYAIQYGVSRSLIYYDLGGIGIESIDKFKNSFGGLVVNHSRWVYIFTPIRLLKKFILWLNSKGYIKILE